MTDPFRGLLDPFAWWDVSATYSRYAGFFDLVVYCAIFIALCHAVFINRFTGRPGRALSTVLGIALGISLAVVERRFGWNLGMASPIAALIALLLVGFLLLHTLMKLNITWTLAAPLTYVIIYLFIRGVSPKLMAAISTRAPFIHLLAAVMFLICVWRIGLHLWPGRSDPPSRESDAGFVANMDHDRERNELRLVKKLKRRLAPEAEKQTVRLERSLDALQKEIAKPQPDWTAIARTSSQIAHDADSTIQTVDRIRVLDRRIRNFDWHQLQQLNGYYQSLGEAERQELRDQIVLERRKILQETAIDQLADACERRHQDFRRTMDRLGRASMSGDKAGATEAVSTVASLENQQKSDLDKLGHCEKRLLSLTRSKLREEERL